MERKYILYHVLFWLAYGLLELYIAKISMGLTGFRMDYALSLIVDYSMLYLGVFYLFPQNHKNPKIGWVILYFLSFFLLFCLLRLVTVWFLQTFNFETVLTFDNYWSFLFFGSQRYLQIAFIASFFWYYRMNRKTEKSMLEDQLLQQQLENNILEEKMRSMRLQVSHSFFPKTLQYLIKESEKEEDQSIHQSFQLLDEVWNYGIRTTGTDHFVRLADEWKYIHNLHALNTLRFNQECFVDFHADPAVMEVKIPKNMLLTLYENIMKYADYQNKQHPVQFWVEQKNGEIVLEVENLKNGKIPFQEGGSFRIGHQYIKSVLAYNFPDSHRFEVKEDGHRFKVSIQFPFR